MTKLKTALLIVSLSILGLKLSAQDLTPVDSNFIYLEERVSKSEHDLSFWKKLKINGWVQAQYQHVDTLGAANVAGGAYSNYTDNRFMLRRGRIKFTYEQGFASYVLQFDVIDPTLTAPISSSSSFPTASQTNTIPFAVNVRDFYVKINAPFWTPLTATIGMQNRPFGFEVAQSSQVRETPERSRFTQTLFPNERDLGAMITLQAPKSSPLHIFKLNAGVFNGAGIAREYDARKDFIGQVMMNKSSKNEKIQYGIGFSYYNGGVIMTDSTLYQTIDKSVAGAPLYVANKNGSNVGAYAKREYFGVDAQISIDNPLGITTLRAEYVQGTQPGVASSSRSPEILPVGACYERNFNAGYFYFIHKIANLPIQLVYKYDFYDPNTKVSGTEIAKGKNFGVADIKYTTNGFGINYLVTNNLKFMFYYDMVTNETTSYMDANNKLNNYTYDKKDNVFTARVQYRF